MIPEYPRFKPLESEDKETASNHLNSSPRNICELNLANLYIWREFDKTTVTTINGNLCLLISQPHEPPYFLEPLGHEKLQETMDICLSHAGRVSRASEHLVRALSSNSFHISTSRNEFDYVYYIKELSLLNGRKFDGKRNHIKRFTQKYKDYEFIKISTEHSKDIIKLFDEWAERKMSLLKDLKNNSGIDLISQRRAIELAFENFSDLGLLGNGITINGSLKCFILASVLNPKTIDVHFNYCHPDYNGICETILSESCKKSFSNFTYINLEQDLGDEGLRRYKLSYHPFTLEKKYEIRKV